MSEDWLSRRIERTLPADDHGPCYTFDIDKTYLDTRFDSWRSALKLPFERAGDKQAFAGVAALIRGLQHGTTTSGRDRPVYFVSASPAQLRPVLERRIALDEIALDGMTLKNWNKAWRRPRDLRVQLGYKMMALLLTRRELPARTFDILFGDSSEQDAQIYSEYAALLTGTRSPRELAEVLVRGGTPPVFARDVQWLAEEVLPAGHAAPAFVFIHAVTPSVRAASGEVPVIYYHSAVEPAAYLLRAGVLSVTDFWNVFRAVRTHNALLAADALERARVIMPALPHQDGSP